jgi:hypothetical protein
MSASKLLAWFLSLTPILGCIVAAGMLAVKGLDGWGWFLFVAVLLAPSLRLKS